MRAWAVSLILLGCLSLSRPVLAQQEPEPPAQGSAAAIEEAKVHFERALAAYREGSYEVAIAELERALELDPNGKDLVYNLGLVYEKLGDVDRAIAQFERYLQMETDTSEAERAHVILRRLEGARAEVERKRAEQAASTPSAAVREPAPAPASEPQHERGRLDAWVFAASGVALAATLVGAVFGVRAVAMRPSDDESTGAGTSAADLEQRASDAHALAIVADVAFGVALASAGAGVALYFLREPEPRAAAAGRTLGAKVEVRF
jgi:tetratricopeptide (TPR) repeat protein